MAKALVLGYGLVVYAIFFVTFLYAIGFVGNFVVPKSIDSGAAATPLVALITNCVLLSLFAVQHSVMARVGFKKRWTKMISPAVERSTFVLAASLLLDLLYWQWQPIKNIIWSVNNPLGAASLNALYFLGWVTVLLGTFLISHASLFGIQQVYSYFQGKPYSYPQFSEPALYRFVRHPIYLGLIIAFWSTPVMTAGHLLFSIATTGYILVGIYFEEKDLLHFHGDKYGEYRRRVPMLIPLAKRSKPGTAKVHSAGQS